MRILVAHNFYQQAGGEDQSFASEAAALEQEGHSVIRYMLHNDAIDAMSHLALAARTLWNQRVYNEIRGLIRVHRPDVAHFNNTFPLISPSAYYASKAEGVPVVQSLRNFRLLCSNALFHRDGHVCEDCLGKKIPWGGVAHHCYRGSAMASGMVTTMVTAHRAMGTWSRQVDLYIALTEFSRQKFIQGGLPAAKIAVKPNFVHPDPGLGTGQGGYAIFVGRLSPEKGLGTLLSAWKSLGDRIPLKIVGDGPLASEVREAVGQLKGVEWLGRRPVLETYNLIGEATFLVFPSEWYETFGRVAIEAFAKGTPVLASNLGAMAEVVDNSRTGLLFSPGDARDLSAKALQMVNDPAMLQRMRTEVRHEFEAHYTAERNVAQLCALYDRARGRSRSGVGSQ